LAITQITNLCATFYLCFFCYYFSYLSNKRKQALKLSKDQSYKWLLRGEDTTVSENEYNYDR